MITYLVLIKKTMKAYMIIRDIIFLILWLAILCTGIYTAKMTDVIDSNLIYVNRKIPPKDKKSEQEQNIETTTNEIAEDTIEDNSENTSTEE